MIKSVKKSKCYKNSFGSKFPMKILVQQLARLGDIYMTWPVLRAIRRAYPMAEIHVLTRPRFESALHGLEAVDVRKSLPTERICEALLESEDIQPAKEKLETFLEDLVAENYQWIINLSYSPFSSYLTHFLSGPDKKISGYTRHSDGYFHISDEVSSYFYAQVGPERYNRIHLADLFASMVGIDLEPQDWAPPTIESSQHTLPDQYIVMHVGASEQKKSLSPFIWSRVIKYFTEQAPNTKVVLIGAPSEIGLAKAIKGGLNQIDVIDLVGKTKIHELFPIIQNSQLLVGCDSAPMHIASLVATPCLNISSKEVNFWETGPRSASSQIVYNSNLADINPAEIATMIQNLITGVQNPQTVKMVGGFPSYIVPGEHRASHFGWDLVKAIYLGEAFPVTDDLQFIEAVGQLHAMNEVVIENLQKIPQSGLKALGPILDRSDEVFRAIGGIVPLASIFVHWLETERIKIPPGKSDEIYSRTLQTHRDFKYLLRAYVLDDQPVQEA